MKKILTSNGKILTENGKILTANVESGGGLIEVTELPSEGKANTVYKLIHKNVGTEVPTTGLIENYYLNVSLSINEVVDILSQLTYQSGTDANTNVVFQTDNHNIICYQVDGAYAIKADNAYVFASNLTLAERLQCSSIGWNVAYITEDWTPKTPVAVNETTLTEEDLGMPIGAENDKVINLFSITPFEEKIPSEMYYLFENSEWQQISGGIVEVDNLPTSGEENYVYKVQGVPTAIPYTNVEGIGIINLIEFAPQEETYIEIVDIVESVDKLPTSNIIESTEHEMYGYYVRNDNYYVYGSFGDDGAKIWVTISALIGLPFVGEITNVSEITELNSVYALVSGGDSADYYIYEKGEPTQVPNSGLIENLYFNTKLSNEEVDNILSQLTYDYDGFAYVVGAYEKGSSYGNIIIVEANAFTQGQIPSGYIIGHMHDTTNMASTDFIYMSNQGLVDLALTLGINTKVGWNMETLNLNQTFIGHYGTENDKLINVISTTPYPHWTKISGGATVKATPIAVPNSGYVERVYFNTKLSNTEIVATLDKLAELEGMTTVIWPMLLVYIDENNTVSISAMKSKFGDIDEKFWVIELIESAVGINTIWSERSWNDGKNIINSGWSIGVNYIDINHEVVPEVKSDFDNGNIGKFNSEITNLFSLNGVFQEEEIELTESYDGNPLVLSNKYVKKTVVPNEGYVERVYFNTSLSVEEVKAIIEKFYTYVVVDTIDNAIWLINIDDFNDSGVTPEKLYWIMPSSNTGDYAIVNALAQVIFKSDSSKWTGGDFVGWNPEFITAEKPYLEINSQVFPIVTENGKEIKVGGFNDKLVDLFSLTPFEEKIYDSVEVDIKEMLEEKKLPLSVKVNIVSTNIVSQDGEIIKTLGGDYQAVDLEFNELPSFWQETVFVNGNYVEKLYFNTELTTDEIDAIFSTLTYDYNSHLITQYATAEAGRFGSIYIIKIETNGLNGYTIRISNFDGDSYIYASNQEIADYIKSNYNKSVEVGLNITEFPINNTIHTVSNEISNLTNLISSKPLLKNTINVESYLDNKQMPMSIKVNIESQEPNLQEKEITENGEYVADEGYDGFSKVTVNVGGEDMLQARVDATNSCEYLFYQYKGDNVDFIKDLDTSNVTNMSSMFNGCSMLKTIPQLDTSNVTDMISMFRDCSALETIPQLDMIKSTNRSQMFYNCSKLTNLTLLNIKAYVDLSQNEKLTLESLINTVKEFINVGSARILTMGTANLEKIASTYVKFTDSSLTTIPTNEKGDVVVCESTDEGAMLLKDYALLKNWTLA